MARPPVAQLIYEQRLKAGLSIRQAAARAGISEGSWRRTESPRKLTRTDETVARMAGAVEITGEQLASAGWPGAARILATLRQPPAAGPAPDPAEMARRYQELLERTAQRETENQEALERLEQKLDRALSQRENRDKEDHDNDEANGSRRAG